MPAKGRNMLNETRKRIYSVMLLVSITCLSHYTQAAGVTIITHGFELESTYPAWVTAMADNIPGYIQARFPGLGSNCSTYKLTMINIGGAFYYFTPSRTNGSPPSATLSGEIIIELVGHYQVWLAIAVQVADRQ